MYRLTLHLHTERKESSKQYPGDGCAADYTLSSMGISVHNFFAAYLIQFGVCGGLIVNALLLSPLFEPKNRYWYLVVCVILGGYFLQIGIMRCMLYRFICFSTGKQR